MDGISFISAAVILVEAGILWLHDHLEQKRNRNRKEALIFRILGF